MGNNKSILTVKALQTQVPSEMSALTASNREAKFNTLNEFISL